MAGIIKFDWKEMKWQGLTVTQIEIWKRLYPHVDVLHEITMGMPRWLDKVRGTKKANKRNWKRFIVNWLKGAEIKEVL